ncbi:MAG: hypothetical protein R3C26_07180 [Calditrichia bacterium]
MTIRWRDFQQIAAEYRLSNIDSDGQKITIPKLSGPLSRRAASEDFQLYANYPNPFNNETNIRFRVGELLQARLIADDINGQAVKTLFSGSPNPGEHIYRWNSTDKFGNTVASGFFICAIAKFQIILTKTIK